MDDYQNKRSASGVYNRPPEAARNVTDLATSQLAVTSTAQQINLVNQNRRGTRLNNLSGVQIFYGPTSGVTTQTGDVIQPYQSVFIPAQSVLWVLCATGQTGLLSWADVSGDASASAASHSVALNKITTIESTTPLGANGVFTGPWHDSQIDGTEFVTATSISNQASIASGLAIDQTNNTANSNQTVSNVNSIQAAANTLAIVTCAIRLRFWRVRYTNAAVGQTSFELTTCAVNVTSTLQGSNGGALLGANGPNQSVINGQGAVANTGDNLNQQSFWGGVLGYTMQFGGAFSGTPNAALSSWSKSRTPTIFKQLAATAAGSTAIWTPGAGNKFRLLAWRIVISQTTTLAAAGDEVIKLLDAATDIAQDITVRIGAAAGTSGVIYDSGWQILGSFGILSAAANNALNVNLGTAAATGSIQVLVAGTEE